MQSQLFSQFDTSDSDNDEFKNDVRMVLELNEEQLKSFITLFPEYIVPRTSIERRPVINKLVQKTGLSEINISRAVRITRFILSAFEDDNIGVDDSKYWFEDLIELEIANSEEEHTFSIFIELIQNQLREKIVDLAMVRDAEQGVLPYFSSANTTVELRAVLEEKFKWGQDIDVFQPAVKKLTPVISINIGVDSGSTKNFSFQVSPEDLRYLISELESAFKVTQVLSNKVD